jgi:2-oxo-3-hexenedioate decarboxylase/2-keto-4-pentenoate hydratase
VSDIDRTLKAWADALIDDNRSGRPFAAPWGDEPPALEDAYRIQDAVLDGLTADRGPLGGYKVALTAKPMQEMMGLTEPLGGLVHAGQLYTSPHTLKLGDYHSPALEFEVAIRAGQDVPPAATQAGDPFTAATIAPFVGEVITSFEVIDTRGADLGSIGAAGLVADRCACVGAVLGEPTVATPDLDLATCAVELVWNGEVVETGNTGAAMGHPFAGLAWIANHLAARGRALEAGQVVLTGSAFTPRPLSVGDTVVYRIEGVGDATVTAA